MHKKPRPDLMTLTVDGSELAELCSVANSTIGDMVENGLPATRIGTSGKNSQFSIKLAAAVKWLTRRTEPTPGSQRAALLRAQTQRIEMENLKQRRLLVPLALVEETSNGMRAVFTHGLDSLSGRLANRFPGNDPATVREIVRTETNAIRTEIAALSRRVGEMIETEASSGTNLGAAEHREIISTAITESPKRN